MKIFSWNVNGLRAVLNKGALQTFLAAESPDILCLQEIKCKPAQCDFDFSALGYDIFWNPADRPGYSGTATLVKTAKRLPGENSPIQREIFNSLLTEGRILTLNFEKFYLVNVYTPNSKPDLSRLDLREKSWDPAFLSYLKTLEQEKPVITCGDFNAAHEEIDIARPKTNHHSAGFTNEARQGITNLISAGFLDTFRFQNPDSIRYTWWSHWGHARENNVGWRIDYFFISKSLEKNLESAEIHENYLGSDHCPISLEMEF